MLRCTNCNGWGVVWWCREEPPNLMEARLLARAKQKVNPHSLQLVEGLCLSCGGYGTRPSRV